MRVELEFSLLFATPCPFGATDPGLAPYGGPNSVKSIPRLLDQIRIKSIIGSKRITLNTSFFLVLLPTLVFWVGQITIFRTLFTKT